MARDHREAYDFWARYFDDPALMANRDARTTELKIGDLARRLPLESHSRVLDVGPGDGALFRAISGRVARCTGVDPSSAAVSKLRAAFRGSPTVDFAVGTAEALPFGACEFDVVVMNSVLHALSSPAAALSALSELLRVCRAGGLVFVGEVPFRSELSRGVMVHLGRKLREFGLRAFARNLWATYARPVLRGEPIVLYPATNLHFPREEFEETCRSLGAEVECHSHRELRRLSLTRNDYLLRKP